METRTGWSQIPGRSYVSLLTAAVRTSDDPSKRKESPTLSKEIAPARPQPAELVTGVRHQKSKTTKRQWPPRMPGSAAALNMLTLRPVFATPVPRHHVEPRAADGSRLVHDRATSERFVVYSPRFVYQFKAGNRAGLWYVRHITDVEDLPGSVGFPTARAAVEAVRAGNWRLVRSRPDRDRPGKPCRVIWS